MSTEESEVIDFGALKKKKKAPARPANEPQAKPDAPSNDEQYSVMLDRIYELLRENNPEYSGTDKHVIKKPKVVKVSAKKSAWINFQDICNSMARSSDHVYQFILAELGTEGSIAGGSQLILKGKYNDKNIETLLTKYVNEYVVCGSCKSWQTELVKDQSTRLLTLECHRCKSSKSVNTIKVGFHAVAKGDRRKER